MSLAGRVGVPMVVAAGLAAFLFLRTFVDLSTPVLLGGDQGFFWMYGERMLHGQLPYRDFFQFTLPGADVAHLAVFALLGPHAWVTDALIVALGASLAVLSFVVARAVMTDASAALASSVLVVLVFGQALTTTHHWWSALFLVAAVAAFGTGERNLRLACAGGLLGLATFCTQTHGVASLLAFAMFLWNRGTSRRRDLALLGGSYVVALFVAMAYFVAAAGPAAVWSCTVSYVVTQMALSGATSGLGLPEALTRDSLPALLPYLAVYALVPAGYALLPRAALRDVASDVRARLTLLWLVGVVLLFEVLISLTWVRLFAVAWPGVIVLVCVVDRARSGRRICLGVAWISVVGLACILARSTHRHHQTLVHLPGGEIVATERGDAEELEWLVEHVVPGRSLFAMDRPSIYLPLGLESGLYMDAAVPTVQTTRGLATRAIAELEGVCTEYVLWSAIHEEASAQRGEAMAGLRALGTYLHAKYHRVSTFAGGDEVWQRNSS